jgi:hypothetical protein
MYARLGLALLVELDNQRAMAPLGDLLRFVGCFPVAALLAILSPFIPCLPVW